MIKSGIALWHDRYSDSVGIIKWRLEIWLGCCGAVVGVVRIVNWILGWRGFLYAFPLDEKLSVQNSFTNSRRHVPLILLNYLCVFRACSFFSLLKQIRFHMNNKEQKDWAMVLKQWSNIIFILSCIHVTRIVYPTFCKLMPLHCNKRIEKICILFWILCHHFVAYIHIISNFVQIQWYACYVHP